MFLELSDIFFRARFSRPAATNLTNTLEDLGQLTESVLKSQQDGLAFQSRVLELAGHVGCPKF